MKKQQTVKRIFSVIYLVAFMILFVTSACEGPEASSDKPAYKNTDNTVYVRLPGEPDRLNPAITTSTYARIVNEQIFLYLLHYDPQTQEMKPQLAKSAPSVQEITEGEYAGGVAYTYELIEEAVWDDGSPIVAKDFEFTLKAIFNPKVPAASVRVYMEFLKDIKIDPENPKKFTIYTDRIYIASEDVINNLPVYPAHIYDPEGLLADIALTDLTNVEKAGQLAESNPNLEAFATAFTDPMFSREKGGISGSGPYTFQEWETGQRIVLTKKENWWGDALADRFSMLVAYPDKLVFNIIPDQNTAVTALKDESIDVTTQIDAKDFSDLKENELIQKLFNLHTPSSLVYYYVGMNNNSPKLSDKRVRKALAHLINMDEVINDLFFGYAERTIGPFHPSKDYYHKELKPIEFSIDKAVALLKEAGWEDTNGDGTVDKEIDGELIELELNYLTSNGSKFGKKMSLLLQDNAKKAGIKINVDAKEFPVLIDDLKRRDYELNGGGWGQSPAPDDPKQIWHSESDTPDGSNRLAFHNAEADALIDEIRETLDKEKRKELYLKLQEIIYEEQPCIFLIAPQERIAIHKRFEAKPTIVRPGYFVNEFKML